MSTELLRIKDIILHFSTCVASKQPWFSLGDMGCLRSSEDQLFQNLRNIQPAKLQQKLIIYI